MIREKEVIRLNNKDYTVISTTSVNNEKFAYIINIDDYNDTLFIKTNRNEVEIINEKNTLGKLIVLFNKKLSV